MAALESSVGGLALTMLIVAALVLLASLVRLAVNRRRDVGRRRPQLAALRDVAEILPLLRHALDPDSSDQVAARLADLLGVRGIALADREKVVGSAGLSALGRTRAAAAIGAVDEPGGDVKRRRHRRGGGTLPQSPRAEGGEHVVVELVLESVRVGTLCAVVDEEDRGTVQLVEDAARLVEGQLALDELKSARQRQVDAELETLRGQIRPHFIYNALNVIASYISTDPVRARALIIDFAKFTRYSFRRNGAFTTLAEELRAIESYLALQQARYGARLRVNLVISPDSLPTRIPYLILQPLVENAVRHGIETKEGEGHIDITARDEGPVTVVTVEDDGAGMDPERLRDALAGELEGHHVGLRNVDVRLRQLYGDGHGLVVDTAPNAGTLITVKVPKYQLHGES